jgi:hypothetical protein
MVTVNHEYELQKRFFPMIKKESFDMGVKADVGG